MLTNAIHPCNVSGYLIEIRYTSNKGWGRPYIAQVRLYLIDAIYCTDYLIIDQKLSETPIGLSTLIPQ